MLKELALLNLLVDNFKALDFGNITFKIKDIIIDENGLFEQSDHINKYKFITPWVALNRTNIKKFSKTSSSQKRKFLCELLTRNLIFLTSEFKINVDKKILTDIELDDESLAKALKKIKMLVLKEVSELILYYLILLDWVMELLEDMAL